VTMGYEDLGQLRGWLPAGLHRHMLLAVSNKG
jgi:hypothetical protein